MNSIPQANAESLVPARECGECQVCCITPIIDAPDIQKAGGSPCRHSLQGSCNIYETRPQVCRDFYCGWRRSRDFPDDWRPDRSGILAGLEVNKLPQFKPVAVTLNLVGNPLKTIRRPDFIDFVASRVSNNVALYLWLPGPEGTLSKRQPLNARPMMEAAAKSRADVRIELEMLLKRLVAQPTTAYVMENSGHDVST